MPVTPAPRFSAFFAGTSTSGNSGLWITDGTAAGTNELAVQAASPDGLNPYDLVDNNGKLIFAAVNATGHYGLWTSDGTSAGTHEITVQASDPNQFNATNLMAYNGKVFFDGRDSSQHYNLWVTDGTSAGTHEITGGANAASNGLNPGNFTAFNGGMLFEGYDASGSSQFGNQTLWTTDGTAAGTHELAVQGASPAGLRPSQMTVFNGKVVFTGYDASGQVTAWTTDGTAAGTQAITGQGDSGNGINPSDLTVYGNKLLFDATSSNGNTDYWVTDGTAAGTHAITGIQGANPAGSNPGPFALYNGKVLVNAAEPNGSATLWITDGTAAGTQEIMAQGTNTTPGAGLNPLFFTPYNGKMLFTGADTSGNTGLWITDGTAAGTQEIVPQGASTSGLNPTDFTPFNGKMLFNGIDASGNNTLWITDGTAAGTQEIAAQGASASGLSPANITLLSVPGPAPTFTAAQAVADATGPLGAGHVVTFTLTPSAALTLDTTNGSPTLTLNDGVTATLDATASTSTALVFRITTATGHDTADLKVTGLALNGAVITEAGGTPLNASALATLPGSDTGLVIDTLVPAVTASAVANSAQASVSGQELAGSGDPNAVVTISENNSVVGAAHADAAGNWTFDPSALAPGAHSLTASETNAAGTTGTAAPIAITVPDPRFGVADLAAGTSASVVGSDYSGQVSYLQAQYGYSGADNVVLGAKVANVFMYSGSGEDALAAKAGSNVLDGGSGSNWLVGASGADGGKDTFFVDGGNGQNTWDTLLNFHTGDMLTLWGYNGASGSLSWSDNKGSAGYQGATLAARFGDAAGSSALVTFGGESTSGAHYVTSTGTSGGLSYLAVARTA